MIPFILLAGCAIGPEPKTGYRLVWADEFDGSNCPDTKKWNHEVGFIRNRELQWYQPDNARCESGLLVIEGRRERKQNPHYRSDSPHWRERRKYAEYTSASLSTKGLHSWKYGRFEMRGRIDTRAGLWPTFWTLGAEGERPSGGEIDIMEYYVQGRTNAARAGTPGSGAQGTLLANAAWGTEKRRAPVWDAVKIPLSAFSDPDWAMKFHVWRMDWDRDSIRLYIDDTLLNTVDLNTTFNRDAEGMNPFRQPHYIILNLAIGGSKGGDPSGTKFPARFEVDYVRIYQEAASAPDCRVNRSCRVDKPRRDRALALP